MRLRISKAGKIVDEEAVLKVRANPSPAVLLAAAQQYIEPRNRGLKAWEPKEVLLSVVPVPPR